MELEQEKERYIPVLNEKKIVVVKIEKHNLNKHQTLHQ